MFILRRLTSESNENNTCLGGSYSFVEKEKNPNEFYRTYRAFLGYNPDEVTESFKESVENDVYGFISYDDGSKIMPLVKNSFYYVMTSDGSTFSNITHK